MSELNNLSVLVTGGAGFIGSNIVEYLLNNGVKFVRILDNLSTGKIENIQDLLDKFTNVEFVEGDIVDLNTCMKCMKNINAICHKAAIGSVVKSIVDPLDSHNSNVNGFFNIILAAKKSNIKRIVYASSSAIYGDSVTLPKVETIKANVLSPYAATKAIDDIYSWTFHKCYGMETIGLIYFNVFGKRQDPNGAYAAVIPLFIKKVMENNPPMINGDGSFTRDFIHIENVVYANILALTTKNSECFGQCFNIGEGGKTTILDLFNTIKNSIPTSNNLEPIFGDVRDGDIPHSSANIDKAQKLLDYKVVTSFKDGIKKTIEYYQNQ